MNSLEENDLSYYLPELSDREIQALDENPSFFSNCHKHIMKIFLDHGFLKYASSSYRERCIDGSHDGIGESGLFYYWSDGRDATDDNDEYLPDICFNDGSFEWRYYPNKIGPNKFKIDEGSLLFISFKNERFKHIRCIYPDNIDIIHHQYSNINVVNNTLKYNNGDSVLVTEGQILDLIDELFPKYDKIVKPWLMTLPTILI